MNDFPSGDALGEKTAIALLRAMPEVRTAYEPKQQTAYEEQALASLVASCFVEITTGLRIHLPGSPFCVEATISYTGHFGREHAIAQIFLRIGGAWLDALLAWNNEEAPECPPYLCEPLQPHEWKLTDQGAWTVTAIKVEFDDEEDLLRIAVKRKPLKGFGVVVTSRPIPSGNESDSESIRGPAQQSEKANGADDSKEETPEDSVAKRVTEFIARKMAEGLKAQDFTRDGIATALGVSGGSVSSSRAWKELSEAKSRASLPSTTEDAILGAAHKGDWEQVKAIQCAEQKRKTQHRE